MPPLAQACFYNGASNNFKVCDNTCKYNANKCTPTWVNGYGGIVGNDTNCNVATCGGGCHG